MPCPRKVRNLILPQTRRIEPLTRHLVPVGALILRRHRRRMITPSLGEHLLAQPRLLIDLQHVDAQMRRTAAQ